MKLGLLSVALFASSASFAAINPNEAIEPSRPAVTTLRRPNTESVALYNLKTHDICLVTRQSDATPTNVPNCNPKKKELAENLIDHSLPEGAKVAAIPALVGYYLFCSVVDAASYKTNQTLKTRNDHGVGRALDTMGYSESTSLAVTLCLPVTGINFALLYVYETYEGESVF
jgi:hypothetical protein